MCRVNEMSYIHISKSVPSVCSLPLHFACTEDSFATQPRALTTAGGGGSAAAAAKVLAEPGSDSSVCCFACGRMLRRVAPSL